MARLLATVVVTLLLLGSGLDAVVCAQAEAPCAGQCGCNEDAPAGPTFEKACCCAATPTDTPEPRPLPPFTEVSENEPAPALTAAPASAMPTVAPLAEPHGLQPLPPRAPPYALLRLLCVQRC